jgi:hypothetical protein
MVGVFAFFDELVTAASTNQLERADGIGFFSQSIKARGALVFCFFPLGGLFL